MSTRKAVGALCALVVLAAACGRSDDTTEATSAPGTSAAVTSAAVTTAPAGSGTATTAATTGGSAEAPATTAADRCAGVTLEATDIGVSADTITVVVMADVGSELAPGLFQGSMDGVKAWAKHVNDNGGLACRKVEVKTWDTKLSATEATNGLLEACSSALATVGSSVLFAGDLTPLTSCPDKTGAATGFPDIPERATDAVYQCNPHVFSLSGVSGSCPYSGEGPRDFMVQVGPFRQYQKMAGVPLHGIYMIPNDVPAIIAATMPGIRAINSLGFVSDGEYGVSGRAELAVYSEFVATMKANKSNIALTGSNDQTVIKLRTEAKAQGLTDPSILYTCSLACYTEAFRSDPNVDGTYLWLPFLPYEERADNAELDTFLTTIGQPFPQSWSAGAWNAGRVLEEAVGRIVAADGPNAVTRAAVLAELSTITDFDSHGWIGTMDLSKKALSPCFVILQLNGGKFTRVYPTKAGTLDCDAGNLIPWSGDPMAEYKG